MTVYEMIQELSKYDADTDIEINAYSYDYRADVEVEEDVKESEETNVNVKFDEDISEFDVDDYRKANGLKIVRILAELK